MTPTEQAVIDAARNYVSVAREAGRPNSPDYLLPVVHRRRAELIHTVERLEASNDGEL